MLRRSCNQIKRIKSTQGQWITGEKEIRENIVSHIKKLYNWESVEMGSDMLNIIPRFVSDEMN